MADFTKITLGNNPFRAAGTSTCEPLSPDDTQVTVRVGLVRQYMSLIELFNQTSSSKHIFLFAPYGGGKSGALKASIEFAKLNNISFAYLKLDKFSTLDSSDKITGKLIVDIAAQFGIKAEQLKSHCKEKSYTDFTKIMLGLRELKSGTKLLILIDELEKVIESPMSLAEKNQFLLELKNLSEQFKKDLSLIITGTNSCLQFIRKERSELLGGRFEIISDANLSTDECKEYVKEKCQLATSIGSIFPFDASAIELINKISAGLPRFIEIICYDCWVIASNHKKEINSKEVNIYIRRKFTDTFKDYTKELRLSINQISALDRLLNLGGKSFLREIVDSTDGDYTSIWYGLYSLSNYSEDSPQSVIERSSRGLYEIKETFIIELFRRQYGI